VKRSLHHASVTALLILVLHIAACAMAPEAPSLEEAIAAGYITVETLAETTLAAHEAGRITDAHRGLARLALQQAKNSLDLAATFATRGDDVQAAERTTEAFNYVDTVERLLRDAP
jgi:hypothetical protein